MRLATDPSAVRLTRKAVTAWSECAFLQCTSGDSPACSVSRSSHSVHSNVLLVAISGP